MCAQHDSHKPSLMMSLLQNKCPRCRRGKLYKYSNPYNLKKFMEMNKTCPVCGQETEMEVGFYYGTGYVSYGLSVAISVATFVAWYVLIGISVKDGDYRLFWWMGFNAILLIALQPVMMRLSRTIWLAIFVRYSNTWYEKDIVVPERTNTELQNAW
ncbi:MAG: DUF983 domain-containing protein [Chitinophagaceae bacterium]